MEYIKHKSYFDQYCEKECKYKDISCDKCSAYNLSEIMQNRIWDLEDEVDELKTQICFMEDSIVKEMIGRRML